jgi:hypothetical protein
VEEGGTKMSAYKSVLTGNDYSRILYHISVKDAFLYNPVKQIAAVYQQLCLITNTLQIREAWLEQSAVVIAARYTDTTDCLIAFANIRAELGIVITD